MSEMTKEMLEAFVEWIDEAHTTFCQLQGLVNSGELPLQGRCWATFDRVKDALLNYSKPTITLIHFDSLRSAQAHIATLEAQVAELTGLLTRSEPILVRFATSNPKHEYDGKMQDPYGVHTILEELKAARAKGGT